MKLSLFLQIRMPSVWNFLIALGFGLTPSLFAWAIPVPLREVSGLNRPVEETAYPVKTAKVVLADYDLVRRDFPELTSSSDTQVDQWLLKNGALMAKSQIDQEESTGLNQHIDADTTAEIRVYRPSLYGRGLVFRTGESGLLDAKGVGAEHPYSGSHSNGLGTLAEMISEYAVEKLVHRVFIHSKSGFETIETYAVLDLGFQVKDGDEWTPAGMVLRQAHRRVEGVRYRGVLDEKILIQIEKVLMRYGMSSSGVDFLDHPLTGRIENLQGSVEGAVVDFGTFLVLNKFETPLVGDWYGTILLDPKAEDFVQPVPELQVSVRSWGIELKSLKAEGGEVQEKYVDHLSEWAWQWVKDLHGGSHSRLDLLLDLNLRYLREENRWKAYDRQLLKKLRLQDATSDREKTPEPDKSADPDEPDPKKQKLDQD